MSKPLMSASIAAPGFFGLNLQESSVTLAAGFALESNNCVLDKYGRLGARKGWAYQTKQDGTYAGVNIKGGHEFIDIDGQRYLGVWSDTDFYMVANDELTAVTYTGSNTVTQDGWQAATLNDAAYLYQRGYEPIYFDPTSGALTDVTSATNSTTVTITNSATVTATNASTVSITHSGTVATVVDIAHKLSDGDTVIISGADQTEYNGTFTVTVLDDNTYKYTMASSPSVDATGTITANTKVAVVTHSNHGYDTGDVVTISGANETGYNGEFTITVLSFNSYFYNMITVPSSAATGTLTASVDYATVAHTNHPFIDGDTVTISGATPSDFNGDFQVTVVDTNTYTYTLASTPTGNPTGTITATWDKGDPPKANTVLSAYGRIWAADTDDNKTTVYWSNLLDGTAFAMGSAGSIDLSSVLVKGNDEIVALGAQNGRLIIFCKDNIVIYASGGNDTLDPVNMQLVEVINGVGCIARDSVQNTGTDILFLSATGLMSLGRVIQEKSQPMRDLSKNIRDDLVNAVNQISDKSTIKSVYSAVDAFYLLLLPEYKRVYCFDTRSMLQDGSARVTTWSDQTQSNMFMAGRTLYFGQANGIAKYSGYQDNGTSYTMSYYTNFFDFDNPTKLKILKRIGAILIGGNSQAVVLKAGFDYVNSYTSYPTTLENITNYEYGTSEYGIAEYSTGTIVDQIRAPMGGDGSVIQIGMEAKIDGDPLSMQRLDIYVKDGRTY